MYSQKSNGSGNFFYVATQRDGQKICDQKGQGHGSMQTLPLKITHNDFLLGFWL